MARTRKNRSLQKRMCARLVTLLEDYMSMSDADAARALGYNGTGTLWKIRRGTAFVDVERLATLAGLGRRGARPNLHWIISGEGEPLLSSTSAPSDISKLTSHISELTAKERRAVMTLFGIRLRRRNRG
jgi:hypothetical protein